MEIAKVAVYDLEGMTKLFESAVNHLRKEGIYQWDGQYPNKDTVRSDIELGCLYGIIEEFNYIGAIAINEQQESEYSALSWDDVNGKSLCIHRLVVHPNNHGQGVGKRLLQFAEKMAADNGYSSIRLDAYSGNSIALHLYERNGYKKRGEVFFPRRELPFICYEKLLLDATR